MKKLTFIEIMSLVAIGGILTSLGLPLYRDYAVRSKVMTALEAISPAQNALAAFHTREGRWPRDTAEAGLDVSPGSEHLQTLQWNGENQTLTVATMNLGGATVDGQEVVLAAKIDAEARSVVWDCRPSDSLPPLPLALKYLPIDCRR